MFRLPRPTGARRVLLQKQHARGASHSAAEEATGIHHSRARGQMYVMATAGYSEYTNFALYVIIILAFTGSMRV